MRHATKRHGRLQTTGLSRLRLRGAQIQHAPQSSAVLYAAALAERRGARRRVRYFQPAVSRAVFAFLRWRLIRLKQTRRTRMQTHNGMNRRHHQPVRTGVPTEYQCRRMVNKKETDWGERKETMKEHRMDSSHFCSVSLSCITRMIYLL